MVIRLVLLSLLCVFALAVNFRDLKPQLSGFYPKKLAQFYKGLTSEQEKLIDEAIMSNTTDREAQYAAIKRKSPELEVKFKSLNEEFVKKLGSLSYYANAFYYFRVLQRVEILQHPGTTEDQLNEFAGDVLQDWNSLNNETRKELKDQFPDIFETINSRELEEFAAKAPYIKPYLIYLIQKWDLILPVVRDHLSEELPELSNALNSERVRAYVSQRQPIEN